jgi:hypothetical protein
VIEQLISLEKWQHRDKKETICNFNPDYLGVVAKAATTNAI